MQARIMFIASFPKTQKDMTSLLEAHGAISNFKGLALYTAWVLDSTMGLGYEYH
jgi:hypothetical protein